MHAAKECTTIVYKFLFHATVIDEAKKLMEEELQSLRNSRRLEDRNQRGNRSLPYTDKVKPSWIV